MSVRKESAKQRRKDKKRTRTVKNIGAKKMVTYAVAAFFAIIFICTFVDQQIALNKKNSEIEELSQRVEAALQESEKLQAEVDNLSDPEYIEKIARERLGLVRPNERVFVDSNKSADNNGK